MSAPRTRRRDKLNPDPTVRRKILAAASTTLREGGIQGFSIAAVLERAALGTRAFYRHFGSKDELVAALFLEMAGEEERRLRRRMRSADTEIGAVAAWIDGRLDLAFDDTVKSDLRRVSLEAQTQMFASPNLIQPAYEQLLKPLGEALQRGLERGVFPHVDPIGDAQAIHGVAWAAIERQWVTGDRDRDDVRRRVLRFCLGGLGVGPEAIARLSL
ncbi:TetR family transcriptional regulator [Mycobacterium alsense]|uniref:TetR family transcriptional regulator n=1 Tax=Mycobacterium alsense TaxID=324058 RepID=A0ABD6P7E6_9MYCO|nr:TetR/AcrR family transcriptional regulator [Mycobacterium alsense]OBG44875.1 TetR family transcriptional regulator [Mycobacterium alsense]OBI93253.1 TetR family transcriptional regulator [Mycobacterium alsense]